MKLSMEQELDLIKEYGIQITSFITNKSERALRYSAVKNDIEIPHKNTQSKNIAKLIKRVVLNEQ